MDPFAQQVGCCGVNQALAVDTAEARKALLTTRPGNGSRPLAPPGVTMVAGRFVHDLQRCGLQRPIQTQRAIRRYRHSGGFRCSWEAKELLGGDLSVFN